MARRKRAFGPRANYAKAYVTYSDKQRSKMKLLLSGMGNGAGNPWDFCPGALMKSSHRTQIPGTLGTGTEIVETVPGFRALGLKSQGQKLKDSAYTPMTYQ